MRKFDTGATRDENLDKLDYKGFTSERADKRFAEYMHKHRKTADGGMRGSDNWKLGIPTTAYAESLYRHFKEWARLMEQAKEMGYEGTEVLAYDELMEVAQAIRFNLVGWVHEQDKHLARYQADRMAQMKNPYLPPEYAKKLEEARDCTSHRETLPGVKPNPVNYDAILWAGTPFVPLDAEAPPIAYGARTEASENEGEIIPADSLEATGGCADPESEDDTGEPDIDTDLTGQPNEIEPHSDEDHDPMLPDDPRGEVVMVRYTHNDKPHWQPLSSLVKHRPFV